MDYRKIQEPVLPLLGAAEKVLARKIGSRVGLIAELGRCTPVGKGKKIRAAFFFLLARLNGARDDGLPSLGAAIEMLHLSSLVHDDIVDHSTRRRGEKTPNHHFGDTLSVLWGDFLFINSIRMLTRDGHDAAVGMLAEASRQMIEGQILEFENNFNYRLGTRTYYDIIRKKTSSLFSGIAALAAGLPGGDARRAAGFPPLRPGFRHDLPDQRRPAGHLFRALGQGALPGPEGRESDPALHPADRRAAPCRSSASSTDPGRGRCWSAAAAWRSRSARWRSSTAITGAAGASCARSPPRPAATPWRTCWSSSATVNTEKRLEIEVKIRVAALPPCARKIARPGSGIGASPHPGAQPGL